MTHDDFRLLIFESVFLHLEWIEEAADQEEIERYVERARVSLEFLKRFTMATAFERNTTERGSVYERVDHSRPKDF